MDLAASVRNFFVNGFYFVFDDLTDARTKNWFLLGNPLPAASLMVLYLMFVLKWGPNFMKDRKPYSLKSLIILFNAAQVIVNAYIFYHGIIIWMTYSWKCQPVDFSLSSQAIRTAKLTHLYFLVKMSDLFDTVFMILRKKNNQASFLHIYHHCCMPCISWGAATYYPGGHGTFGGFLNSGVHVIMYSYYIAAALITPTKGFLKLKRYITIIQLLQFGMIYVHALQLFVYDCDFPRWQFYLTLPLGTVIPVLFLQFYRANYIKAAAEEAKIKEERNKKSQRKEPKHQNGIPKNGYRVENTQDYYKTKDE